MTPEQERKPAISMQLPPHWQKAFETHHIVESLKSGVFVTEPIVLLDRPRYTLTYAVINTPRVKPENRGVYAVTNVPKRMFDLVPSFRMRIKGQIEADFQLNQDPHQELQRTDADVIIGDPIGELPEDLIAFGIRPSTPYEFFQKRGE